ncbi:Type III secretion apparatus [Sodalis praecaptivus]|uniref:Type III secretion apparatus n=2 Tax=Enterobacterales TaxID=91347 RepID=W0HWF0_9GAMM|nr:EscV/YscV/HrcV family type III secretion system export apparatus protein [Sodalis praecaptivus]AHF78191.1 Type III secretion apparatus [Sodalis praecaptivus]
MINSLLYQIKSRPELIILAMMVLVIVMLIIPLPTYLIDFLIGLNLTMAILIFMGSFYISRILDFSSFPSILLVTTLFRLAISISTSRLVLMDADAGEIVASFGQFVIGDNLVVGFVIFFIVTVVQFIVITKGSERIAEVAARFSLDAMPGKQMSIDADLKAGVLDEDGVKKRREVLEAESQLYGALDGAMKFIKGDAIAGIIIIFVNLIGGISVGMVQHGMELSEALTVYTHLSIGDALVAQIPALLISISGGFIVTRVNNNKNNNLGSKIITDLFANQSTLMVTACLALAMGFLPGFPLPVFMVLSALLIAIYFKDKWRNRHKNKSGESHREKGADDEAQSEAVTIDGDIIPETLPLMITFNETFKPKLEQHNLASRLKKTFFIEYGVRLPEITIGYAPKSVCASMNIAINEIPVADYMLIPGMHKILINGEELKMLDNSVESINTPQGVSYWLPEEKADNAHKMGYITRSAIDEFYFCISTLLTHNISEFFGIQETKMLLDDLEKKYPELLKESYRNNTVQRISEVFQRLLQERISIRNMKLILESLVQWGPKEKDPIMLVEHVRGALGRYICNRFSYLGKIRALVFAHDIEEKIRGGIRQTSGGSFINLTPPEIDEILHYLTACLTDNGMAARDIILLVSVDIRRFIKKLVEGRYPELEVLSFNEMTDGIDIDIIATIQTS